MKRFLVTSSENNKKLIQEAIDDPPPALLSSDESMVHNPLAQSTTEVDKFKNNYLFDGTFYKVISNIDNKLAVQCQLCNKTIHGNINYTGNFLNHIKVCMLIIIHMYYLLINIKKQILKVSFLNSVYLSIKARIGKMNTYV